MDVHPSNKQSTGPWTDEEHVRFLNTMEDSFVRTMLENNSRLPRLDRYLPDTADSTLDLKSPRRKKHLATSGDIDTRRLNSSRADKRSKKLSHHDSSQDQVVPQIESSTEDKVIGRDHTNVALGTKAHAN